MKREIMKQLIQKWREYWAKEIKHCKQHPECLVFEEYKAAYLIPRDPKKRTDFDWEVFHFLRPDQIDNMDKGYGLPFLWFHQEVGKYCSYRMVSWVD